MIGLTGYITQATEATRAKRLQLSSVAQVRVRPVDANLGLLATYSTIFETWKQPQASGPSPDAHLCFRDHAFRPYAALLAAPARKNSSRSALITSALVAGMPCGKPG